jgi:hypothetical protein
MDSKVVGMLSIKDLIKELQKEKDDIITKLSDFNIGKGAFFQHGKFAPPESELCPGPTNGRRPFSILACMFGSVGCVRRMPSVH